MLEWKSFETGSKSYWKEISAIFINFNVDSTFDFSSSCSQFHQHFTSSFFGQLLSTFIQHTYYQGFYLIAILLVYLYSSVKFTYILLAAFICLQFGFVIYIYFLLWHLDVLFLLFLLFFSAIKWSIFTI